MPNPICPELKQDLENIKALKQEFDLDLKNAFSSRDTKKAQELRKELEAKIESIKDKLWPFEALEKEKIEEQYNEQREVMEGNGIIEKLSNGKMGIKGIDPENTNKEKEYVFPELEDILKKMKERKEILETKAEQGFDQLLIVPFGMKLDDLIEKYKQVILKHHKEGKLLATKKDPSDPDESLDLNESEPIRVLEKSYKNAEAENKIVYYPEKFDKDSKIHKGKTKQEILKKQEEENPSTAGFEVFLVEDLPNIPREGQGQKKGKEGGDRKQLEAGKEPKNYLEILKNDSQYKNEQGQTPETQIIYAIGYLEKHNQVIDYYGGNGSASYQLGAYFPTSGDIPNAYWARDVRLAYLGGDDPGSSFFFNGVRSVAMVF